MARRGCGWVGGLRVIVGVGIGIADWSVDSGLGAVSGAFGNGGGGGLGTVVFGGSVVSG